jgi:hypothetical protein
MRINIGSDKFRWFSLRPLVVVALMAVGLGVQPVFADSTQTITFDDMKDAAMDAELDGQFPAGVIDWGNGAWYLSSPWLALNTNSISFVDNISSASFSFVGPHQLVKLDAYNGDSIQSTVTLKCAGQSDKQVQLNAGELRTIETGWSGTCSSVNVSTTNGWQVNFDNLVVQ